MKPTAKVLKEIISSTMGGKSCGKNALGKITAAAVPYRKKSYHSMLVPASEVIATRRIFCCWVGSTVIPIARYCYARYKANMIQDPSLVNLSLQAEL